MNEVESQPASEDLNLHQHGVTILDRDWTDEEERRAKRKLDMIIMPLLALGYFCLRKPVLLRFPITLTIL